VSRRSTLPARWSTSPTLIGGYLCSLWPVDLHATTAGQQLEAVVVRRDLRRCPLGGAPPCPEELRRDRSRVALPCRDRDAIAARGLAAQRVAGDDTPFQRRTRRRICIAYSPASASAWQPPRRSRGMSLAVRSRQWACGQSDEGARSPSCSTLRNPRWLDRGKVV
jgi:hypothetical protein